MKYSVYNRTHGNYTVYEGPATERKLLPSSTALGFVPDSVSGHLPLGSVCLGQSDVPEGAVVDLDWGVKDFFMKFAVTVSAMIAARLVYDWFFGGRSGK